MPKTKKKPAVLSELREDVIKLLESTAAYIKKHPKQWTKNSWGAEFGDDFAPARDNAQCTALTPTAKQFCAEGFAIRLAGELFGMTITTRPSLFEEGLTFVDASLTKKANRIFNAAQKVLDHVVFVEAGEDGLTDYNDNIARRPADVRKQFIRAAEYVRSLG